MLYYHSRYYDPKTGRFISADSIVPGADGGVIGPEDGAKLTPLTVDFHEPGFAQGVGEENRLVLEYGFLDEGTVHGAPADPQALNRYAYVLNNPLKYTDPTGHQCGTATPTGSCGSPGGSGTPGAGVQAAHVAAVHVGAPLAGREVGRVPVARRVGAAVGAAVRIKKGTGLRSP